MTHAERLRYIAGMREWFSDTTESMFVGEERDALLACAEAWERENQQTASLAAMEAERDAAQADCRTLAAEVRRCWDTADTLHETEVQHHILEHRPAAVRELLEKLERLEQ